jgi:hypothetical protein
MLDARSLVPAAPLDFATLTASTDAAATAAERTAQGMRGIALGPSVPEDLRSVVMQIAMGWEAFAAHMRDIGDGAASVVRTPEAIPQGAHCTTSGGAQ